MCRRVGIAGILLASTLWLGGCALWEGVGPCYGVGCHAGLVSPHSAAQQSAQAPPAPAPVKKSRSFASWLPFGRKHAAPATSSAVPAATPASAASTSAAPSATAPTSASATSASATSDSTTSTPATGLK